MERRVVVQQARLVPHHRVGAVQAGAVPAVAVPGPACVAVPGDDLVLSDGVGVVPVDWEWTCQCAGWGLWEGEKGEGRYM